MNTEQHNKLIAEFMGYFPQDIVSKDGYLGWWSTPNSLKFPNYDCKQLRFSEMEFNSSWDWLMPVVERIEEHNNGYTKVCIEDESCQISTQEKSILNKNYFELYSTSHSKIDATYKAVVEFVEWYIKQNKTNQSLFKTLSINSEVLVHLINKTTLKHIEMSKIADNCETLIMYAENILSELGKDKLPSKLMIRALKQEIKEIEEQL